MDKIKVKVKNTTDLPLPKYQTEFSAGVDLMAAVEKEVVIHPGKSMLIPTGLHFAVPPGYEGQIRPRSGLALKYGISIVNSPGTLDADYRGELQIILINHGSGSFVVKRGDRIAQMVIKEVAKAEFELVEELDETERKGGFGSTGKN